MAKFIAGDQVKLRDLVWEEKEEFVGACEEQGKSPHDTYTVSKRFPFQPVGALTFAELVGVFKEACFESIATAPEEPKQLVDNVRQPTHYQVFPDVEAIEIIAKSMTEEMFKGYCLGNILKYRLRAGKKAELATVEQDLKKAAYYIELFGKNKHLCHE